MTLENESVEHVTFGSGVITEAKDHKIRVQFKDEVGTKLFLYPEAFERFLKAVNPTVENNALEDLHRKQEQIKLEEERKRKEREAIELEEEKARLELPKKKTATKSKKKQP